MSESRCHPANGLTTKITKLTKRNFFFVVFVGFVVDRVNSMAA